MGYRYRLDPYFSYVNLRRMDELERLHEHRDDSHYLIAIPGGSVADQFATYIVMLNILSGYVRLLPRSVSDVSTYGTD